MSAIVEPVLMTVREYEALPDRPDVVNELHWGNLVTLSHPKPWHTEMQHRMAAMLQRIAGDRYLARIELPFRSIPEYDLRAADVALIARARWEAVGDEYLLGAPELVVEILSPSNCPVQLREYAALCLANGCELFLIVDRDGRTVTAISRTGGAVQWIAGQSIPIPLLDTSLPVDPIFPSS